MRLIRGGVVLTACAMLAACGGGASGVSSAPAPAPSASPTPAPSPAPTPTPTAGAPIADLQVSQSFNTAATATDVALSLPDGIVQSTSTHSETLSITYDAASKSYTVATPTASRTYTPADARPIRFGGEVSYTKQGSTLTLVTIPYMGTRIANRYVGMGYWQQNGVSGSTQQTAFSTFAYGFETAGAAVPRSGTAHWLTDVFGLLTLPGKELRVVQGLADFDVDFGAAAYRLQGYLTESQVVSTGGTAGALNLQSGGPLSSGNGFSGLLSYQSSNGTMHGALAGRFYGPGAEEVGASFNAEGVGAALSGALTGQRSSLGSTSDGVKNITLTNPSVTERLYARLGSEITGGGGDIRARDASGIVNITPSGPSYMAFNYQYDLNPQDIVADGRANFTTYKTTLQGAPLAVSVYKQGAANQELALTYTGFVSWIWPRGPGGSVVPGFDVFDANYAVYGINTPRDLMTNRTGTASYAGILYGQGASLGGTVYDLTGTSRFDVDFSAAQYSGSLAIRGTSTGGGVTDFGTFGFTSFLGYGEMAEATITGGTVSAREQHVIRPQFFGPSGQEIGAAFWFQVNQTGTPQSTALGGIAIAKSQ